MSELDPAPLDAAQRRALDAIAVRLAHDDPRFAAAMRPVGSTDRGGPLRRGLTRALVLGTTLIATVTLLLGAGAGLVVGLLACAITSTTVALHLRRTPRSGRETTP